MLSGNSENVEQWLRDGTVDIGFVENASRRPWLHYERLMADELVLVAGTHGRYASLESVTPQELRSLPLVLREKGSGTREILENVLGGCGIGSEDLNVVIELSSTEAIKAFVRSSDTLAVVSVRSGHAPGVRHSRPSRRVLRAERAVPSLCRARGLYALVS